MFRAQQPSQKKDETRDGRASQHQNCDCNENQFARA